MTETPLDIAHAAMQAAPDNDAARLRFFERLADGELFLLLKKEATKDTLDPELFEAGEGRFVLVFDREQRLAEFVGQIAPYAVLSGRVIAEMLRGQEIGLGVNLGVAASEILIPPEGVAWLAETLEGEPAEVEEIPEEFSAPVGLPQVLFESLAAKLAMAGGLSQFAYLAAARYGGGRRGHMLVFINNVPGAEGALAQIVREALVFSGLEAGELDVGFLPAHDPACASLARVGLRFDLPAPHTPGGEGPSAPGMDPDRPPKLR